MKPAKNKKETPAAGAGPNLANAEISEFVQSGKRALFLPIDIASLVVFRLAFGLILLWEVFRYFDNNFITNYWVKPGFLFSYWPFDFLKPLPGDGMYILYYFLGLLAFCITIGLFYRISSILFFLGMSYSFLLDQARYLNHQYLVCLISLVMIFIPANRAFSVDAKIFKGWKSDVIPAWPIWLVRFTVGLPYFFGGIAKINSDWLRGEPLRTWLASDTDFPIIGPYFTEDWMIYCMSYAGLLFDLLIIPGLLFKRTRKWAFLCMLLFNLMNARLFEIGIFPWFMMFASTVFFHPSWPRIIKRAWNPSEKQAPLVIAGNWDNSIASATKRNVLLATLSVWTAAHVLLPLRHFLIPGNVHWTEEGHKYAWHMKLRTKRSKAGIYVRDKQTGDLTRIRIKDYLSSAQARKMPGNPDMLWQFARMLKSVYAANGRDVSVHANVDVTLNGRAYQPIVSPDIDLSAVSRPVFGHAAWILPLNTPLSKRLADQEEGDDE